MAGQQRAEPDRQEHPIGRPGETGDRFPIVVTGPTGWIGSALLARIAGERGTGWEESVRIFGSSARPVAVGDAGILAMRPLRELRSADLDGAMVIHLAYLTKENVELLGESQFFETNAGIDAMLLEALRGADPRGVFVASSGAASLAETGRDRHLYGVAKLLQEDRFLRYGAAAGVPVLAGRIFNIAGPFINKLSSYALSSFLCQALTTGRIAIAARVPVYRSYLHVDDVCALILRSLECGAVPGKAVDLAGAEALEIVDVARAAALATGLDPRTSIERGAVDYDRPSIYLGDPTWARTTALRLDVPLASFVRQVRETLDFLHNKA